LEDFTTCEKGAGSHQRELGTFVGDFNDFRKAQKAENLATREADNISLLRGASCVGAVLNNLVGCKDFGSTAGNPPFWIRKIDTSHPELKFGAGMVFCNCCGALSSSDSSSSHLFKACRYSKGLKIAPGSEYRLNNVRAGKPPERSMQFWPDGRPALVRIDMRTFWPWSLGRQAPQQAPRAMPREILECDQVSVRQVPVEVPEHIVQEVFGLCNQLAEEFQQSECLAHSVLSLFGHIKASPDQIAEAIKMWSNSSFMFAVIDNLLERSFKFETDLDDFTQKLLGAERPSKRSRLRTKGSHES
jgi:hypothetical protein